MAMKAMTIVAMMVIAKDPTFVNTEIGEYDDSDTVYSVCNPVYRQWQ